MSKHTPGPWKAVERRERFRIESAPNEPAIADVYHVSYDGDANARLISAAPDLLAACQRILAAWNSVPDNVQVPDEINDDAAWLFLETAIAKATGEQP